MNICNKKLIPVLGFLVIFITAASGAQDQAPPQDRQDTFYYSFDKKVYGKLDTSILAVQIPKEMDISALDTVIRTVKSGDLPVETPYVNAFQQEGVIFIKLDKPMDIARFFQFFSSCRDISPKVRGGHPFFVEGEKFPLIVTDEFVVRFKPEVDEEWINRFNRSQGVEIVKKNPHVKRQYLLRVTPASVSNALSVSNRFQESGRVVFSHPNFLVHIEYHYTPADTNFPAQWHLHDVENENIAIGANIDAVKAWDYTRGDPNVVIAVIDAGFDVNHEDLDDNYLINSVEADGEDGVDDDNNGYIDDIKGWSFIGCSDNLRVSYNSWHGQAVAGLAAAEENGKGVVGVCPQCRLLLICNNWSADDLAKAFYYARERGADIITCSWSRNKLPALVAAIDDVATGKQDGQIIHRGIPIFFSTGDNGDEGGVSYPACDPNTIAVGASDCNDSRASYSQYGPEINILAPSNTRVNGPCGLVTTGLCTSDNRIAIRGDFNGTSGATPIAAGTGGLMLSINPNLTSEQVREILQDTADKIDRENANYDDNGFSITHGYGRINAYEAVKKAKELLPVHRDPVDIVLVLDYSGSMKRPAEPGGRNKIEVLKDAVEIFLRTWGEFAHPDDRIAIVYFKSDVNPLNINLRPLMGNVETLMREIRDESTGGFTAMGGALQVALTGLSTGTGHPAVILLTNGIQNVNPMLVNVDGHYKIINKPGSEAWGGTSSVPENPDRILQSYGIPVHIIGIGEAAATSYHGLLDGLRSETGGLLHLTTEVDEELSRFFLEDLVETLNLGTLEMVSYTQGTIRPGQTGKETFVMDGAIRRAAFLVHWVGNSFPGIKIDAPHNENLQPTRWINGKFYRIACFDFPYALNGEPIDPVGTWTIYPGEPGRTIPYQAALMVDETDVHYNFDLPRQHYWTGDPIIITAQVTESDTPIKNLTSVKAALTYPKTSLGTLLSEETGTPSPELNDLHSSRAYSKLLKLLENPVIRKLLEPRTIELDLYDDGKSKHGDSRKGDGIYSAKVTDKKTEIPGLYTFVFDVEGETSTGWPVKRTQIRSTIVHVKPDRKKTQTTGRWIEKPDDGSGTALITVIPYDSFGNYLGPDYGNTFLFSTTYGELKNTYDALDGSYEFTLHLEDRSKDPTIHIRVLGLDACKKPLSEIIQPPKHYGLSAHCGYAIPDGNLNLVYNPGFSWGVDMEFLLSNYLSLEALFGRHSFGSNILPGTYWMNFSGNLKWFWNTRRIRPFIDGGGGLYKTGKDSTLHFGFNVGGGIAVQVKPAFYIESAYNYHNVYINGDNVQFSTAQIGLRLRF